MSCVAISTELDMAVSGSEVCVHMLWGGGVYPGIISRTSSSLPSTLICLSVGWNRDHTYRTSRPVCGSIKASGCHPAWTCIALSTGV